MKVSALSSSPARTIIPLYIVFTKATLLSIHYVKLKKGSLVLREEKMCDVKKEKQDQQGQFLFVF